MAKLILDELHRVPIFFQCGYGVFAIRQRHRIEEKPGFVLQ